MILPTKAYNPSLARYQNRLLLSYRHHDRGDWRTNLGIAELNERLEPISVKPLLPPKDLETNSFEDARFFIHRESLWASFTISQWPASVFRSVVGVAQLLEREAHWEIASFFIPAYGSNSFEAVEKNWVFFEHASKLYSLYLTHGTEQTILEFDQFSIAEVHKSAALAGAFNHVHGGAMCRAENGNYLHFFNSRTGGNDRTQHRYQIWCAELAGECPFEMLRVSSRPILAGQEGACTDKNPHWKSNVVFCCGAIRENGQYIISHGFNDAQCRLARLTQAQLKLND